MIYTANAEELFVSNFFLSPEHIVFSHGRLEILGNHTDHNHGLCLVGGVDMGITGAFSKTDDGSIEVISQGYKKIKFDINDLIPNKDEYGTSKALVKGVLSKCKELGFNIGGFKGAFVSDIFPGAGVSSSACYESLIVKIVSMLYNEDRITPLQMAKIGKYAENVYFGKPCGLLDQIGTSFGGMIYVDFESLENPVTEVVPFNMPLKVVLINTGGSHANLTPLYASIGEDMKLVAQNVFDVPYLRMVSKQVFFDKITKPNRGVSELAKMRATHYFEENERVIKAKEALKINDVNCFLDAVNSSGCSSSTMLQNTMVPGQYKGSPQEALDILRPYLGNGAERIMGGGFAGSIIAFTFPSELNTYMAEAIGHYGAKNVKNVNIVEGGPKIIR